MNGIAAVQEGDNVTRLQAMFRASALSTNERVVSVLRTPGGFMPKRGIPPVGEEHKVSSVFFDDHLVYSDSVGDLVQNYFGRPMDSLDGLRKELGVK